ncbi:hypothetical protein Hanom_Chr01g00071471 [Helianthus anomalus]
MFKNLPSTVLVVPSSSKSSFFFHHRRPIQHIKIHENQRIQMHHSNNLHHSNKHSNKRHYIKDRDKTSKKTFKTTCFEIQTASRNL